MNRTHHAIALRPFCVGACWLLAAGAAIAAEASKPVPDDQLLRAPKVAWTEKVVYFDSLYDCAHSPHPESLVKYLTAHGFQHKDARALGQWMRAKVAAGAYGTVGVLSMGIAPSSVFTPEEGRDSLVFQYLRKGGRILWLGDVPLAYFQTETSGSFGGTDEGQELLGARGGWDKPVWGNSKPVQVTPLGKRWGLSQPAGSVIATYRQDVTAALSTFYSDDAKAEAAVDWFQNFAPQYPWSGFIYAMRAFDLANPDVQQQVYRLALFAGEPVEAPKPVVEPEPRRDYELTVALADPKDRSCYVRGETIPIRAKLVRLTPLSAGGGLAASPLSPGGRGAGGEGSQAAGRLHLALVWQSKTLAEHAAPIPEMSSRAPGPLTPGPSPARGEGRSEAASKLPVEATWQINTVDLACGDYELTAEATVADRSVAKLQRTLSVCPRLTEPTFFFGAWAPNPQNPYRCRLTLEGFARHGLQLGTGGPEMNPRLMDEALKHGLRFSMRIHGDARGPFEPDSDRAGADGRHVPSAWGGGRPMTSLASPILRRQVAESFAKQLADVAGYPALWPYCHTNDDFSIRYGLDYCGLVRRQFREQTGLVAPVPPEVAKAGAQVAYVGEIRRPAGVIPEDDPWLLWYTFSTRDVGGGYNRAIREAAQKVMPQVRVGPVPGGMQWPLWLPGQYPPHDFGPQGFNCLWYYYYLNYWQPQVGALYWDEVARLANRDLPLWVTAGLCSVDEPTYYRNKFFLHLAGGVEGFNYFTYGEGERRPRGMAEIGRLGTGVVRSYYPLLGRLRPARHRVGLLLPYTHSIYDSQYPLQALYAYGNLLAAHVDVEPTCEEEAMAGELKRYRAVLLYRVKWLRRKAFDALVKYAAEGGLVLADASTELDVPGAKRLDVDLAMGPPEKDAAGRAKPVGGPGIHDYAMPDRIRAIREAIERHVRPEFESPSIHLVIREAQAAGIRYLWLVNLHSHEDYEYLRPRVGAGARPKDPKTAAREAIAYLDAKDNRGKSRFTAPVLAPKGFALYDVLAGQPIPTEPAGDRVRFTATMDCLGGQLVALYPRPIAAVELSAPAALDRGHEGRLRLRVLGDDRKPSAGSQPVRVEVIHANAPLSEWTGNYVTTNGTLDLPIRPASNHPTGTWDVRVNELSSGKTAAGKVVVR